MFLEALAETGRDMDLEGKKDIVWDVIPDTLREDSEAAGEPRPIYGAEDVDDDRWTLLHWACILNSVPRSAPENRILYAKSTNSNPGVTFRDYFHRLFASTEGRS